MQNSPAESDITIPRSSSVRATSSEVKIVGTGESMWEDTPSPDKNVVMAAAAQIAAGKEMQLAGSRPYWNVSPNTSPACILDLPDEVKKNLVGYDDLELDELLLRIIGAFSAAIAADRIIMLLYTSYQKSPPRGKVLARLRYLTKSGAIHKVEGARSMYVKSQP